MKLSLKMLKPSFRHFIKIRKKLEKKLVEFPKGSIKKRIIKGQSYYYLQKRFKDSIFHRYLGKAVPEKLSKKLQERLKTERLLKETNQILSLLKGLTHTSSIIIKSGKILHEK
jgi:hypothetical protein